MDKKIRSSFENLSPGEEQKNRMWDEIVKKTEKTEKKSHKMPKIMRLTATFALVAIMLLSIGTMTNAATNGKVMEVIRQVLGIEQLSQSVSGQAQQISEKGTEIWAPEIYGMNDEYIIFGTKRGLVIYDRAEKGISATIDTQKIGCIYFDSMEKDSHVLLDGDNVAVYNSENGQPYGDYYVYNVREKGELEPITAEDDWHEKWLVYQKNYRDTFDMYHESEWFDEYNDKMGEMYGRRALLYDESYNFFMIKKGEYLLYSENNGEWEITPLPMGLLFEAEQTENEVLPMFEYTGENKAIAAICDWFYEDAVRHAERGKIWIPGFIIRHEDDKNGEHLVFGNFWNYGYVRNGNMLEQTSGGEWPSCFHMKELADGSYQVVSVDRARDGNLFAKDIKEFCKGYFGLASKIMKNDTEERRAAASEYAAMYVEQNNLDIEYIKEYGWDPYKIFE